MDIGDYTVVNIDGTPAQISIPMNTTGNYSLFVYWSNHIIVGNITQDVGWVGDLCSHICDMCDI